MRRLRKASCLFPDCYDITCCLKRTLGLMTVRAGLTLGCHLYWKEICFDVNVRVILNVCLAPEVYQDLGGKGDWVLASVTESWCVQACVSGWLAGPLSQPALMHRKKSFCLVFEGQDNVTSCKLAKYQTFFPQLLSFLGYSLNLISSEKVPCHGVQA